MLKPGDVLCFEGNLGAGKTTLIKAIISSLQDIHPDEIQSPTYSYVNEYKGELPIYHFDLYRLNDPEEFVLMGFDEYLDPSSICLIEWPEKATPFLPSYVKTIHIEYLSDQDRMIQSSDML